MKKCPHKSKSFHNGYSYCKYLCKDIPISRCEQCLCKIKGNNKTGK